MAQLLKDIINTGNQQENWYDGFMGAFGGGIKNRNYVPSVDPITKEVEGAGFWERLSGISDEEKKARYYEIKQQELEGAAGYDILKNAGLNPELTTNSSVSNLNKKGADFKETGIAKTLARRSGATGAEIKNILGDGPGYGQEVTDALYVLAEESADRKKRATPEYQRMLDDRNRQIFRENRVDDERAYARRQDAQLRRDRLIESKETRMGNQELAMLKLNSAERLHKADLAYKRELDARNRQDNIAAALGSLTMSFFA